jgi:hypothetical protein
MLLGKLKDRLYDTEAANIKAGFRKCGIVPLDRQQVLARLPNHEVQRPSDVGDNLVEFLQEMRYGQPNLNSDQQEKPARKNRLQIQPGKSVSKEDLGQAESLHLPSSSPRDKEATVIAPPEANSEVKCGDHLLTSILSGSQTALRHRIGQVLKVGGSSRSNYDYNMTFMVLRNKTSFEWPTVNEIGGIRAAQIVRKLPTPHENRGGCYSFECDLSCYSLF